MAALAQANRSQFGRAVPSFGASRDYVQLLEHRLRLTSAERDQLQAEVSALHASTSWSVTRPLRWLMEALGPKRGEPIVVEDTPEPPTFSPPTYEEWIAQSEADAVARLLRGDEGSSPTAPRSIAVVHDTADMVATSVAGLDADLVCFLPPDCTLTKDALALVTARASREPGLDIIFGDEDWLDESGRRTRPFFKPGWSPTLQRERDLLGPCTFLRTRLAAAATIGAGPAWRYDLANQVAAATRPERIGHIPAILCHRIAAPDGYAAAIRAAASVQLARDGVRARVEPGGIDGHRVSYDLPDPTPLVSVIIPTRDHAELLGPCTDGLLHHTDYPRLELLIVDNGTVDPEALALLDRLAGDPRVTVLHEARPFNWAALNNQAARYASGEVLLLLNNDIAVLRPDWLSELVGQAIQPGVGAAGAKLLYPDGRIQHAGITTDLRGYPRHPFRYAPGDDPGAFGQLAHARDVWGVTGACMAIRRDVFFAVGGLNEVFTSSYNDVDFCLRLTASGYRIVWTPWSVLEHRELATRPADHSPERRAAAAAELHRLQADWGAFVQSDVTLHPSLELIDEQPHFVLPRHQFPPASLPSRRAVVDPNRS